MLAVTVGAGADNPPNGVRTHLNLDVLAALDLRGHGGAERIVRRHDHEGEHHLADDVQDRVRNHLRHAKATNGHTDRGNEQEER